MTEQEQLAYYLIPAEQVEAEKVEAKFYETKRYFVSRGKFKPDPAKTEAENAAAKMQWEEIDQKLCAVQCALIMRWRRVVIAPTKKGSKRKTAPAKTVNFDDYLSIVNEG